MAYYVYLLKCSDETLYCGYTTDPERRLKAHNSGSAGAKYTRSRRPCELVYVEDFGDDKQAAMSREWHIKHDLTREEKWALVQSPENVWRCKK